MESLCELYKIGHGPSSSHTLGPQRAASIFKEKHPHAYSYRVTLYGSLAATGKGHLTDHIIIKTFEPKETEIIWKPDIVQKFHTNCMDFEAIDIALNVSDAWRVYSIGGGTITDNDNPKSKTDHTYPANNMSEILAWAKKNNKCLWQYIDEYEDPKVWDHLKDVWKAMQNAISRGLNTEGNLPGPVALRRKAMHFKSTSKLLSNKLNKHGIVNAYALAASEENAGGGIVVTAPTCGSAGVIPGVLRAIQEIYKIKDTQIIKALGIAGLFGITVQQNGSIAGAEVGCQGEVGVACSMAAAAATYLLGGSIDQIEYAAEMGLEHHLGMTCDPVCGMVQIPCIERNAVGAVRAIDCAIYALISDGTHSISFDQVVAVMLETGLDLQASYKETSRGGLAKIWEKYHALHSLKKIDE